MNGVWWVVPVAMLALVSTYDTGQPAKTASQNGQGRSTMNDFTWSGSEASYKVNSLTKQGLDSHVFVPWLSVILAILPREYYS